MVNKVILLGRLGQDPEKVTFENGGGIVKFTLATSKSYKKDNEWVDMTTWHNIDVRFDKLQESAMRLKKGDLAAIEGEINNSSYEKEGQKRYFSSVVAHRIRVVSKEENSGPTLAKTPEQKAQPDTNGGDDLPF